MISAKTTLLGLAAAGLLALLFVHCPCRKTLASTAPMAAGALGKSVKDLTWSTCDGKDGLADINKIEITGVMLQDTQASFKMAGVWKQTASIDSIYINARIGFTPIFDDSIKYTNNTAVVGQPFENIYANKLPLDVPSGTYKVTLKFLDKVGAVLQCVNISYRVS